MWTQGEWSPNSGFLPSRSHDVDQNGGKKADVEEVTPKNEKDSKLLDQLQVNQYTDYVLFALAFALPSGLEIGWEENVCSPKHIYPTSRIFLGMVVVPLKTCRPQHINLKTHRILLFIPNSTLSVLMFYLVIKCINNYQPLNSYSSHICGFLWTKSSHNY